jgi:hypothetical protein
MEDSSFAAAAAASCAAWLVASTSTTRATLQSTARGTWVGGKKVCSYAPNASVCQNNVLKMCVCAAGSTHDTTCTHVLVMFANLHHDAAAPPPYPHADNCNLLVPQCAGIAVQLSFHNFTVMISSS